MKRLVVVSMLCFVVGGAIGSGITFYILSRRPSDSELFAQKQKCTQLAAHWADENGEVGGWLWNGSISKTDYSPVRHSCVVQTFSTNGDTKENEVIDILTGDLIEMEFCGPRFDCEKARKKLDNSWNQLTR